MLLTWAIGFVLHMAYFIYRRDLLKDGANVEDPMTAGAGLTFIAVCWPLFVAFTLILWAYKTFRRTNAEKGGDKNDPPVERPSDGGVGGPEPPV